MSPSTYYYGPFREHFAAFWKSLNTQGSVSRVRNRVTLSRFAEQAGEHFSVVDLVAQPSRGLQDHLNDVPVPEQLDFLCAVFYTVLIDQVMYTHRRVDYPAFRALTQYPKMDRTVGYSRTLMMANPYELFEEDVLRSRSFTQGEIDERFSSWAKFIVEDLRCFFASQAIGSSTWDEVREAMLHDPSCTWGSLGIKLANTLRSDSPNAL